jgi:hypothetical protein
MTADPSGTVPSGADPTPRSTRHWIHRWLVFLIVGFAGFCSLVYQVVWERTLKYNFGGDSVSAAIVTATFLLGLGIGAVAFGRFPLLLRLASPTGQSLPATTGWVALVNAVGAVVLASEQPVTLDRGRAEAVLAPRAQEIGLAPPYADWLLTDWRSITRAEVGRRRPIRDDLLIYEYQFDPLGWLVGSRRRQAGSRRDAAARSGFTEASSTPDARGSRARHPGRSRKTR